MQPAGDHGSRACLRDSAHPVPAADTYRQVNLTAEEIADLTGEIIAFPDHMTSTPQGRLVARDRTFVALTSQQTFAALIRRVPAVLDGETAIRFDGKIIDTALTRHPVLMW